MLGSSPRVRGLQQAPGGRVLPQGIIPARAGFTTWLRTTRAACGDHPRACGVYTTIALLNYAHPGSSPRVRGLRVCRCGPGWMGWIIPARAGFTRPVDPA